MPGHDSSWAVANPPDQDSGSFTGAEVIAMIGQMVKPDSGPREPRIPWDACHPIWQTGAVPLTAGAGTLQQGNQYGPETPYWWDLRTISVWGFTAGTVTIYLNSVNGEQLGQASVPGQFTWSAQALLGPQDNLLISATGITGVVNVTIRAVEVATAWLPEYLM
jgi:hypothetical protein